MDLLVMRERPRRGIRNSGYDVSASVSRKTCVCCDEGCVCCGTGCMWRDIDVLWSKMHGEGYTCTVVEDACKGVCVFCGRACMWRGTCAALGDACGGTCVLQ